MSFASFPLIRRIAGGMVAAYVAMFSAPVAAENAMTSDAAAVKAIDSDCSAIHDATMALKPIHVMLAGSTWKIVKDADWTVAQRTHASVTFVDAWKQGKSYAWIHAHSFDQSGNQRAAQMCFRQKDGSLQRVKQAGTLADADAAESQKAYYASDGKLIMKTATFEVNDPLVAKKIQNLPYYKNLP